MAKDRAAPFSRKHRRYWLPVTGGMILIGSINVMLGVCTYERAGDPEPIHVQLPHDAGLPPGQLGVGQIPGDVMRAFAVKYPQTIPSGARLDGGNYVVLFPTGAAKQRATFGPDGTFIADE